MNISRIITLLPGALVVAAIFAVSCGGGNASGGPNATSGGRSSSSTGGRTDTSPGGANGSGGTSAECIADVSCECEPGHYGLTTCESGAKECSCDQCAPYEATSEQTPDFEACGGEPFGEWRLTKIDNRGIPFSAVVQGEGLFPMDKVYTCPAEVGLNESGLGLISLKEGGVAYVNLPSHTIDIRFVGNSCSGIKCENIQGCKPSVGCDMCECVLSSQGGGYEPDGVWSRDGTQLSLPFPKVTGEYCVKGKELEVNFGTTGLHTFEKVNLVGRPQECEKRSVDACESTGCDIGECVGGDKCTEAASASVCSTLSGCDWDDTVCRGTAPESCATKDYGRVPGCEIVTEAVHCEGEAPKCQDLTKFSCEDVVGCGLGVCTEESPYDCADFDPPDCDTIVGCTDGDTTCVGTAVCSEQTKSDGCFSLDCYWDETHCQGMATSCEGLEPDACRELSYCTVVAD